MTRTPAQKAKILAKWQQYQDQGMNKTNAAKKLGIALMSLKAWKAKAEPKVTFTKAKPLTKQPKIMAAPKNSKIMVIVGQPTDVMDALKGLDL